ncbi:protein MAIN-LIKE 1-like [Euphorbia lathyris]|uniref:protein MAIN-LIKE 1-like n=1 Tax=Euphorbia lathyris TaxID=212925 RepID=UPI0033143E37
MEDWDESFEQQDTIKRGGRGVTTSVRRDREALKQQRLRQHIRVAEEEHVDDVGIHTDMDETDMYDSGHDEMDRIPLRQVKKGRGGRFVTGESSARSSKRFKDGEDDAWLITELVPGGPIDGSVIPSFNGHVAVGIWKGQMRSLLKCHTRSTDCKTLTRLYRQSTREVQHMIDASGLSHLPSMMFSHIDMPLICAFVERWQPDTSSFHMPFGEMTIMLHDVWHILRIPVEGQMVTSNKGSHFLQAICMMLLGFTRKELLSLHYRDGRVYASSVIEMCSTKGIAESEAIGWMWLMLGSTLFVDKSVDRIQAACLLEVHDGLNDVTGYSWGSAALAYLYRQLGIASRGDCGQITGCLTLLQAWIYEYFPCFRPQREGVPVGPDVPRARMWSSRSMEKSEDRLSTFRFRLDRLTAKEVMWMPYGPDVVSRTPRTTYTGWIRYRDVMEPYMPGRCLRQLGYVQTVPMSIIRPSKAIRPWTSSQYQVEVPDVIAVDIWRLFPDSSSLITSRYIPARISSACHESYISWYYRYSHPRVINDIYAPIQEVLTRFNNDFRVNRMANLCYNMVDVIKQLDKDESVKWAEQLAEVMSDWHLAR